MDEGMHELLVVIWEEAPVQSWPHVVQCVVSIIEEEKVDLLSNEVPCKVVPLHVLVTSIVLQEIHGHDGPLGKEVGDPKVEHEEGRAQVQQVSLHSHEDHEFHDGLSPDASAQLPLEVDVSEVILQHIRSDAWLEEEEVEEIGTVVHFRGPHHILLLLRELVVAQIMPGDIRAHGMSISERQDDLEDPIEQPAREHGAMHRVMGYHGSHEGEGDHGAPERRHDDGMEDAVLRP